MITDELHSAIAVYREMLAESSHHPLELLNAVDRQLANTSNHIAVCHRVVAEHRVLAQSLVAHLSGARRSHLRKEESAGKTLDEMIMVQEELFDLRQQILQSVMERLAHGHPTIK
jgi:hypothetical protein